MGYDKNFEILMGYIFGSEGEYVNHPNDHGGPTNYGVTQQTYNFWRKKKGLKVQDVKLITRQEAKQLYYEEYWKPSGATKTDDLREAYVLFDTAIICGVPTLNILLKKSGNNMYKLLEERLKFHLKKVKDEEDQKVFKKGWVNRINDIEDNMNELIEKNLYIPHYYNEKTPFDEDYNGPLVKIDTSNLSKKDIMRKRNKYQYLIHKQDEIMGFAANIESEPKSFNDMIREAAKSKNKHIEEDIFERHLRLKNQSAGEKYKGYKNPVTGEDKIYTREDIDHMSETEYHKHKKAITAQKLRIGIPTNAEMEKAGVHGGVVHVNAYTKGDGTHVKSYWRSAPH